MVKNLPAMQETWIQSLGQENALEEEMVTPLQRSCQDNRMDREAWRATVHRIAKSRIIGKRSPEWQ